MMTNPPQPDPYGPSQPAGGQLPAPTAPYGQPPMAPYGQQAPAPYGQQPPATAPPGTNGFAIASLILAIVGVQILAWIFGGVALSQIKRTGQGGRGMAIAGIVIGCVWVGIVIILAVTGALVVGFSTS